MQNNARLHGSSSNQQYVDVIMGESKAPHEVAPYFDQQEVQG